MNTFGDRAWDNVGKVYIGGSLDREYTIRRIQISGGPSPRHNYVLSTGEKNVPFLAMHRQWNQPKIAWVFVPESMRWHGLWKSLLGLAFEIAERTKSVLQGTCVMRKPDIAGLIEVYGFAPEKEGVRVKIVGRQQHKWESIPIVYPLGDWELKTNHGSHQFLFVSKDERDAERDWQIVVLNSTYKIEDQIKLVHARMKARANFLITELDPRLKI